MFDQTAGGKTLWELTGVEGKDTSRDATETVDGAGRLRIERQPATEYEPHQY
jgi:hypothetical protein